MVYPFVVLLAALPLAGPHVAAMDLRAIRLVTPFSSVPESADLE